MRRILTGLTFLAAIMPKADPPNLSRVIEQVSKEKGIDRDIIVKALEEAMLSAAKKTFGHEKNIEAKFSDELGEVELFEIRTVVETIQDPEPG